jgi:hypothetical protein
VEFALTACAFILVLAVCLEVSRVQIASMLLERSLYDIAHQIKVNRGKGASEIVDAVIAARNNGLFGSEDILVSIASGQTVEDAMAGGTAGSGAPSDVVRIRLDADLSLFKALVPAPLQVTRSITYYFRNEPEFENVR